MSDDRAAYRALIDSDRVSQRTRDALLTRGLTDSVLYEPVVLNSVQLDILRAALNRLIPQSDAVPIDLAARLDSALGAGVGDGWRRAELPPDAVAYQAGLATLADEARHLYDEQFSLLDVGRQDVLLQRMREGHLESADHGSGKPGRLNASQMRAWFYDLLADAVKLFVAHPQTLAAMGYSGIANGGDGLPKTGFEGVGVNSREFWEPVAPSNVKP